MWASHLHDITSVCDTHLTRLRGQLQCGVNPSKQNICITFVRCWTNVKDAVPTLYKCYTNILCLLG